MSLETIDFDKLNLRPGDRVLDLGCGEGRHSISAYLTADVHVVGVDISDNDLRTAQQRLTEFPNKCPAHASCNFIRGSGFAVPFPDNSFDKVICAEVLEHIPHYDAFLDEIKRVLKPGGTFAVSVPRYVPEWICWQLSDAYHAVEGGHVRIFRSSELVRAVTRRRMRRYARHWAHSLHVPYWWLRCLFWEAGDDHPAVQRYHKLLVWDLMSRPAITRIADKLLNPLMGKSIVMYFVNEL
ncbi:MAG: class I SAM-dependent methyltransferase [Pseudomonadota bacterium]